MAEKLIRMIRDDAGDGPISADVHPDEIENYKLANWRISGAAPIEPEEVSSDDEPVEPAKPARGRKK